MIFQTFKRTYTLPFKFNIPNYKDAYINETSLFKRFFKFLRRFFYMTIYRQSHLEQFSITPKHKKILWINLSAPSLGDSLMDLSSRVLLKHQHVDLFTHEKNAPLYQYDTYFKKVVTQSSDMRNQHYDLIIIDSYSTRSLKIKCRYFRNTPFVGLYGYYNGPEVNRVLYSFHQMNALLTYPYSKEEIVNKAKPHLDIPNPILNEIKRLNLPKNYICITLGGEWEYRTYRNYTPVLEHILAIHPQTHIVLVGSSNGSKMAQAIMEKHNNPNLINRVNQHSYLETAAIIQHADLLITCDGGLMHAANAVSTPLIALFAHLTPTMQLTHSNHALTLFDPQNVNNIKAQHIIEQYTRYWDQKTQQ